jgi:hypothetical protein
MFAERGVFADAAHLAHRVAVRSREEGGADERSAPALAGAKKAARTRARKTH